MSSATLLLPFAPQASAAQRCYNDNSPDHGPLRIVYNNGDGSFSNCAYDGEYEWLSAFRDGVSRGVLHVKSNYESLIAQADFLSLEVDFHPVAESGYVTTTGGGGQANGWSSEIKVGCHDGFTPMKKNSNQGVAMADFAYHVGEVAKTNNKYYSGPKVAAAELVTPKGNRIYYAPQCTDLHEAGK